MTGTCSFTFVKHINVITDTMFLFHCEKLVIQIYCPLTHTHTYTHTNTHTHIHTHIRTHTHTHTIYINICFIYIYLTCIYLYISICKYATLYIYINDFVNLALKENIFMNKVHKSRSVYFQKSKISNHVKEKLF